MAWINITSMAGNSSKVSATTTLDVTIGATGAAVGAFVIVGIAVDNTQTTDVEDGTDITGVTDSVGNTYTRLKTFTNGQGAAAAGATVGIYYSVISKALATNDIVTASFASATAKAVTVNRVTMDVGNSIRMVGSTVLANDGADPESVTVGSLANVEHLFIHMVAHEGPSTDAYTPDSDYTLFTAAGTTGGTTANMSIRGSARVLTGTTDTVDVAWTARDHAQAYIAVDEVLVTQDMWGQLTSSGPQPVKTAVVPY